MEGLSCLKLTFTCHAALLFCDKATVDVREFSNSVVACAVGRLRDSSIVTIKGPLLRSEVGGLIVYRK